MKRVHLIANTKSGKGKGAQLPAQAQAICDELGFDLVLYSSAKNKMEFDADIKRAVRAAVEEDSMVVAAGGDGTIRSVAQEAAEHGVRFGAVAVGTFNFFARNHRLPEDPEEAFRLALTGNPEHVRLGEVNGQVFLINATIGLYAKSISEREQNTKRFGRNRFVATVSTLVSLFKKPKMMHAEFDTDKGHMKVKTPMIFIGNNDLQLENLSFKVADRLKKDELAVILFKPVTRSELFRILIHTLMGKPEENPQLDAFGVRKVDITTNRKSHDVALDGEMFHMQVPIEVKVLPKSLLLVAPPEVAAPAVAESAL